jgi:hypothetical protein
VNADLFFLCGCTKFHKLMPNASMMYPPGMGSQTICSKTSTVGVSAVGKFLLLQDAEHKVRDLILELCCSTIISAAVYTFIIYTYTQLGNILLFFSPFKKK